MGCAYRNFWSLNTDEAVATGILRDCTAKNIEVLMPMNAQMKDTDLVLMNMDSKKSLKIQVKGSRAYEPQRSEVLKYGSGSAGWFSLQKDLIQKSSADYFIFLIYVLEESTKQGRRIITPHTLAIPTRKLQALCKKYKKTGKSGKYNFFFWINPIQNTSFEFRDEKYDMTNYLDKNGFEGLNKALK
jgi:hypothetical protein